MFNHPAKKWVIVSFRSIFKHLYCKRSTRARPSNKNLQPARTPCDSWGAECGFKNSRWTQIDLNNYLRSYQIRPWSELFISLFSDSASRASRVFNHSNATGIDIISKEQRAFQDSKTFSLLAVSYFSNSRLADRNCLTIHQTGNVINCVTSYEYFKIRSFHNAATLGEAHHCPHYPNGIAAWR